MDQAANEPEPRIDYLAHSANDDGAGVVEPVRVHSQAVADRAAEFAALFDAEEQAYAAGLLHDLGKYADRFLRHLDNPGERAGDHWSAGALFLAAQHGELGILSAVAVSGHHAGLPSPDISRRSRSYFPFWYRTAPWRGW